MRYALAFVLLLCGAAASAAEPADFGRGSWQELRHRHNGRPTIVHFWGLTCSPCLVELPEWGRFVGAAPDADVVMVAADPVAEEPARLSATLAKAGLAKIESWRFADRFTERLEYEVQPDWHGELPLTILIGRDGSVSSTEGTTDFAELHRWVEAQNRPASK